MRRRNENMPLPILATVEDEERLVTAVLLRKNGAERRFVEYVLPVVSRICRWRLARLPGGEWEEARQDVLEKLLTKNAEALRRWQKTSSLIGYIAKIAANHCTDAIRSHTRQTERVGGDVGLLDPPDPSPSPEVFAMARDLKECVMSAMARLSQTYRRLIQLRYVESLMHGEIARRLNRTNGYVAGTLARAERYLLDEVKMLCGDHLGPFKSAFNRHKED